MNKSCSREFRIMRDNWEGFPFFIEYRYFGMFKLFGWYQFTTNYSEANFVKTFRTEDEAIEVVNCLIKSDNYIIPKYKVEQIWPKEEDNGI